MKTVETPRLPSIVQAPWVQIVAETVESPLLEIVKETIEIPEMRTAARYCFTSINSPDTAGGVHVDRDDLRDEIDDHSIMFGHVVSAGRVHVGKDDPDYGD